MSLEELLDTVHSVHLHRHNDRVEVRWTSPSDGLSRCIEHWSVGDAITKALQQIRAEDARARGVR